jgi:Rieske Fe-S protein
MKTNSVLRRRNFVKTFALFTAYSCLGGKRLASLFITEVAAQSSSQIGLFRMNFDNFPELQSDFGSVRLAVTGMVSTFPEIVVTRLPNNVFYAVTSRCTHQGCTVEPYDSFNNAINCPCHGSQYAASGTVIRGPAPAPLTPYKTTFDGDKTLAIAIPGLGYSATIAAVANPATGGARLRLEFPTIRNLQYEVRFRASLSEGDWTQVPFSTTADGDATETVFSGTNTKATVYVDRNGEGGFYAVVRY